MVVLTTLASAGPTKGQGVLDSKVTLDVSDMEIKSILLEIEKQVEVNFTYRSKHIQASRKVSLNVNNARLSEVLDELFTPDVEFIAVDEEVLLRPVSESEKIAEVSIPEVVVSGRITDENNSPLPGVNILEKGTTNGTTSDGEGRYTLAVQNENSVLVVSFIGYTTQEVTVGAQKVINLQLSPDIVNLSEVVVIGYGTQKRSSLTGAVASVDATEISALPVPGVESALQGRIPGVSITNNGSPGTAPIVRIRGIGSITGNSDPLYVVDGFPINQPTNLNNFDTKDIESVEILKDAAASAIYGSRAANGVVIITTKQGSKDKRMHVDVDSYYGAQTAWKLLDLLNTEEYIRYGTDLVTNAGAALPTRFSNMNQPIYPGASQTYAETETDWQDAMFRTAPITQTQVSLSNAGDATKFFTSAGYFKQDGIMLGTGFERYSFRLNSESKISKMFRFGENFTVSYTNTQNEPATAAALNGGGRPQLQHIVHQVPYLPIHDPTLQGGYRAADASDGSDPENPVRVALMDMSKTDVVKIFGTAYIEASITPWLRYKFSAGGDFTTSRTFNDQPIYNDGYRARTTHNLQDNRGNFFSPLLSNQITVDKTVGKHVINFIAVAERQDFNNNFTNASAQQSSNAVHVLGGGSNQAVNGGGHTETTLLSYLGRVNYEFDGKYLLSASFRRDGFSSFAPGHQWGNFPGLSVGWRISDENFMRSVSQVSELKLRASYGKLGVNSIAPFAWQSSIFTNTTYPFNNVNTGGAYFNQLPNNELGWETTTMTNYGFDLGLWENRFTLSAEYYNRKVDNLLLQIPLAPSLGYAVNYLGNLGEMKNWGFEFIAGYHKGTGGLRFDVSANIGITRNEVTDLYIPNSTISAGLNADYGPNNITRTEAGYPIQGFYGWKTDGLFQSVSEIIGPDGRPAAALQNLPMNEDGTVDMEEYNDPDNKGQFTAPGDIRFKDLNGDGVINLLDQQYLGSYLPKFNYGLNFSANYNDFDFTFFFQGVHGNKIYNGTKVLTQGMLRLFGAEKEVLNAWRPDNTNTDIPRAVSGDPNGNTRASDRFVEDGSYLRLKNVSIGYNVPADVLRGFAKGSLSRLRIYVSSQNLVTITKYTGYDPEIGARNNSSLISGIDYGQFPQARTIMGGLQLGF
ncbi:MAG TPA: TonB-dependent receptor [Chryseosolibacter sp.]|nr:TonB-dependent receptor [Chryseosolibacter sp.]